ncbi:L-seryl-tRNA(Sec) kinase [Discoglossus pictus]
MCEAVLRRQLGLCVLCGLPGAGKSTLTQMLSRGACAQHIIIITYDDIITAEAFSVELCSPQCESREVSSEKHSTGEEETSLWKQHRRHLLVYIEQFIVALLSCSVLVAPPGSKKRSWNHFVQCLISQDILSCAGADLDSPHHLMNIPENSAMYMVLDDNFYYQSMRYEVYQLARKYSLGFCQIYLHCSLEQCLQRNRHRPHPVPDTTVCLMEEKMEKPNPEKNPWEQNSLSLDTSKQIRIADSRIIDLLNEALQNPLSPLQEDTEAKDKDRAICAASILHQADQSLRRLISETMKTMKGTISAQEVKFVARDVQNVKSKLLDNLRQSMSERNLPHRTDPAPDIETLFKEEINQILQTYLSKKDAYS